MEYVAGRDLSAFVRENGPLPHQDAVKLILQTARGLAYAHSQGVFHRDVKPANLLLDTQGVVKILDMGLAKIESPDDAPGNDDLTGSGMTMGTVAYMAPEQALCAKNADGRADIYSLGCTLFYLLTGEAPYQGDSLMATLLAHREQPIPSLTGAQPAVPAELDAVFRKMVAKKVEDRYQTMSEVITALESRLGQSRSGGGRSVLEGTGRRRRLESPPRTVPLGPVQPAHSRKPRTAKRGHWGNSRFLVAATLGLALLAGLILKLQPNDASAVAHRASLQDENESAGPDPSPLPPRTNRLGQAPAVPLSPDAAAEGRHAGAERNDNSLHLALCWCPAGSFRMGSPAEELEHAGNEGPVQVTLSRGFWLGKTEVTQSQWQEVMGTDAEHQKALGAAAHRGESARIIRCIL